MPGPFGGHRTPPLVLERFRVWHVTPARPCRWLGCERATEFVLVFAPPSTVESRPLHYRHLPVCAECAEFGLGVDVGVAARTPQVF